MISSVKTEAVLIVCSLLLKLKEKETAPVAGALARKRIDVVKRITERAARNPLMRLTDDDDERLFISRWSIICCLRFVFFSPSERPSAPRPIRRKLGLVAGENPFFQ